MRTLVKRLALAPIALVLATAMLTLAVPLMLYYGAIILVEDRNPRGLWRLLLIPKEIFVYTFYEFLGLNTEEKGGSDGQVVCS